MRARLAVVALCCLSALAAGPDDWVPLRWEGGPAELARRTGDKTLSAEPAVREAIARWYEPQTLDLLEGTPFNCLLLTLAAGTPAREYARLARARGFAVLGVVRPGADAAAAAALATDMDLDGVVLEGESPPAFAAGLRSALGRKRIVLSAVQGVQPSSRHVAEDGIRATPTTEPWIESNIWQVRSFRLGTAWRPVWISQGPRSGSRPYYLKSVADAAAAGGRWIVALDDDLRAKLFRKDPDALETWRKVAAYSRFPEEHAEWRTWAPYGNIGIVLDTAGEMPDIAHEYLNLVARRQVPYRVIERSQLSSAALKDLRAVLAADLARPTDAERKTLSAFAADGGVVIAGGSWGEGPKADGFAERRIGKGRLVIYKDDPPDPDAVARDMLDLLPPEVIGLTVFNVPSVLTYASTSDRRVLVQLVNYAEKPFDARITVRVNGSFKRARLFRPDGPAAELVPEAAPGGFTQAAVLKLGVWGAVLFE